MKEKLMFMLEHKLIEVGIIVGAIIAVIIYEKVIK